MFLAILGSSNLANADTKYSVFCADEKIEIDMRTLEEMKSARGSHTCMFSSFSYLSEAESFVEKNFGKEGSKCSCG